MSDNNRAPTLEIFLTNLKEYNNGSLIGQWVNLPVTAEEFHEALKDIGIGQKDEYGQVAEEYFVSDYDSVIPGISRLEDAGEYPNLNKLNQIAADYDNLSSWEQDNLNTLMETSYAPDTLNKLGNLINDSYALTNIHIIPDGADDEKLAEYYIDDVFGRDLRSELFGEELDNGDFLIVGDDFRLDNDELFVTEDLFDYEEEEEREEEHLFSRREQFLKKLQPVKDLQSQNRLQEEERKSEEPEPEVPEKEKPRN